MNDLHAPLFLEAPSDKGIVIFIHGFLGSPRQFDVLARAVHKQGCSVAVLLLPGHGGTAKEFSYGTREIWQDYVDSEVERFSQDYKKIWFAAHSMGGLLAINAAVKYSEFVRGIIPIASPFKLTLFSAYVIKVRMLQIFSKKVRSAYLTSSSVSLSLSLLWHVVKPYRELKKLMSSTRQNLSNISAQVTAVYSTADEVTSIRSLDIMKSGLSMAPFEQVLLTDSLHAYYPEKDLLRIKQALFDMTGLGHGI